MAITLQNGIQSDPSTGNGTVTVPTVPNEISNKEDSHANSPNSLSPIAIVGMAMRLPGGVRTADEFWDMLVNKKEGRCPVPENRYNIKEWYHPSGRPGTLASTHGHFIHQDLGHFDREFFSMSPNDASKIDPQQRLLLEVVWECMENAGQTDWQGKNIGCYVGTFGEDWLEKTYKDPQTRMEGKTVAYMDFAIANRISHAYDLTGPSMTMRTACSSSLVALHAACEAISNGHCDAAVVAGSSLIFSLTNSMCLTQDGLMSPNGACKSFDASADGYARGEAINAIFIKKKDDAVRNNDPIRAIVRGTATNFDGRTASMSTPNPITQEQLMRHTYKMAGIDNVSETGFIECHATGTAVGDPLEAEAVARVFGKEGITMGALKSNIGHSEGASALSGVIKAVLSLEHRQIPPNLNFSKPHPKSMVPILSFEEENRTYVETNTSDIVPVAEARLSFPTELREWPKDRLERASVNAFGIGGVNAHAIIESDSVSLPLPEEKATASLDNTQLLVFSGHSKASLQKRGFQLQEYVKTNPGTIKDLSYTLAYRREHLKYRAFMTAQDAAPNPPSECEESKSSDVSVAYVFTGQGAQWPDMGKQLINSSERFRASVTQMDKALQALPHPPAWTIMDKLSNVDGSSQIDAPEFSQTLSTALQIGVVDFLREWNIHPSAVVGHSSGEIAAAYAAGALTTEAAIAVAYYRGQVGSLAESCMLQRGAMAAVGLGHEQVIPHLMEGVSVACENSPNSVTISGNADKLDKVLAGIQANLPGTFCRKLRVNIAYHSAHMKLVTPVYKALLDGRVTGGHDRTASFFSSVTGKLIPAASEIQTAYWCQNMENPVLFHSAVTSMLQNHPCDILVEIGPHSAMAGPIRQIMGSLNIKPEPRYIPAIVRGKEQASTLMTLAGTLHSRGVQINLGLINNDNGSRKVLNNLPLYPWQHDTKYWEDSRIVRNWRLRQNIHHELLGSLVLEHNDIEPTWRNKFRLEDVPWLQDHRVDRNVVFPCTGYVAMAGEAIRQVSGSSSYTIRHLVIKSALIVPEEEELELFTALKPVKLTDDLDSTWFEFSISSYSNGNWIRHCSGKVLHGPEEVEASDQARSFARKVPSSVWYRGARNLGITYGPYFQGLGDITADPVQALATATTHANSNEFKSIYALHPAVIDQALQVCMLAACNGLTRRISTQVVPEMIGEIHVKPEASSPAVEARSKVSGHGAITGTLMGISNNSIVLRIQDVQLKPVDFGDESESSDRFAAADLTWGPHIDLSSPNGTMWPIPQREHKLAAEKLGVICIIESADQTKSEIATVPHLKKFQDWLHSQTALIAREQYSIFPEAQHWLRLGSSIRGRIIDELKAQLDGTSYAAFAEATTAILQNVHQVLSGEVHGLELLSKNDCLTQIYNTIRETMALKEFFTLCGRSQPSLRVLEIGAGTGGTTASALEALVQSGNVSLYSNFTFTDISAGFFAAAKERFSGYDNVRYQVLDISQDPIEQGFEPESYDLIIAANVLHATPSLFETLTNTRKLLAPGGRLFLQELCGDLIHVGYLMGSLSGWWLGEEDNRASKPYVSPERWDYELRRAGYTGTETVIYDDVSPFEQQAHIISRPAETDDTTQDRRVVLLYEPPIDGFTKSIEKAFSQKGYTVTWCVLGEPLPKDQSVISLLDLKGPFFHDLLPEKWTTFQKSLSSMETGTSLLWPTRKSQMHCTDPRYGFVHGVARSAQIELSIELATLELDSFDQQALDAVLKVYEHVETQRRRQNPDIDLEYIAVDDAIHVARFLPASLSQRILSTPDLSAPKTLECEKHGFLESLTWLESRENVLQHDQVEVAPHFVGLNFRDVLVAMGIVDDASSSGTGLEGSGIVTRVGSNARHLKPEDRVMFISNGGSFTTSLLTSQKLCVKIPDNLTLEEASTMPCVFSTVVHCLVNLVKLEKEQTILIHSAAGGVGQAAIQVCQSIGAKIYATVGSDEKAQYLKDTFGLQSYQIFNSRNTSFLEGVMQETQGQGVDVVLNSLSGELLHTSWKCVASFGTMVEIGKRDLLGHASLSMNEFLLNRAYVGVDLAQLINEKPEVVNRALTQTVDLYNRQAITSIRPVHMFDANNVQDAFRYMQRGTHIGKIVVKMPSKNEELVSSPSRPKFNLSGEASYLLTGGLGGVGRSIATWMVENGARHLVFLSRSAGRSAEDEAFFEELGIQGSTVTAVAGDVAKYEDIQRAVSSSPRPIKGVLQLSMVLRDRAIIEMNHEEWSTAVIPKVTGTWNLHRIFGDKNESGLDFFILMSSIGGLRGSPGQSNYAAANTFLNAFSEYRHSMGLPASVINLGVVEEVGFVARTPLAIERYQSQGAQTLGQQEVLDVIHLAIVNQHPSQSVDRNVTQLNPGVITKQSNERKPFRDDVSIRLLHNQNTASQNTANNSDGDNKLKEFLSLAASDSSVLAHPSSLELLISEIRRLFASLLSLPEQDFDVTKPIASLGVDSLISTEIRRWWRRHLGLEISVLKITNAGSVTQLGESALKELGGRFRQ